MLRLFRDLLAGSDVRAGASSEAPDATADDDPVATATTALLTQMVRADFEVKDVERERLRRGVRTLLDLDDGDTEELLRIGEAEAEESVSLYDFTQVLHRELDPEQKSRVVELLWSIAFADGELDSQEEFLVRKVARLLHVPHSEFIAAKQRARARYLEGG